MKWKMENMVSTPECIFGTIQKAATRPVWFLLLGPNCIFKSDVRDEVLNRLTGSIRFYGNIADATTNTIPDSMKHGMILTGMGAKESSDRELCQKIIHDIRKTGAKTVIGVYAKAAKQHVGLFKLNSAKAKLNRTIDTIERCGPQDGDFDHFIVVEE